MNAALIAYHGTDAEFEKFDPDKMGSQQGRAMAFWFTSSYRNAGFYGHIVMTVRLSLKNPLVVDGSHKMASSPSQLARFARSMGYDGVVINDTIDGSDFGTTYVAFHPEQIAIV